MPASNPRIDELRKKFDENPRRYFAPLANEYRKAGDLDQAIEICRTHLQEQPSHMSGHVVFGQALYEAKQFEEGRAVFEAALQLDPENLIALKHLGDIERETGNALKARGWYRRVLDADPRNEEIQTQLAALPPDPSEGADAASDAPAAEEEGDGILGAMDWSDVAPVSESTPEPAKAVRPEITTLVMERVAPPNAPEPEAEAPSLLDLRDSTSGMAAVEEPLLRAPVDSTEGLETTHFEPAAHHAEAHSPLAGLSGNFDGPADAAPPLALDSVDDAVAVVPPAPAFDPNATAHMEPMELDIPELPAPEEDPAVDHHRASVEDMMAWKAPSSVTPMSSTPVSSGAVDPLLDDSFAEFTPAAGVPVQRAPERAESAPPVDSPATIDDALWAPQEPSAPPAEEPAEQVAEETPGAFVTETMAELYVRQGLIEHAVGVYQQLIEQSPGDTRLQARLDQLEGRPAADVAPEDLSLTRETQIPHAAPPESNTAGPSMRDLLARIAATRLGTGAQASSEPQADEAPAYEAPAYEAPAYEAAADEAPAYITPAYEADAHQAPDAGIAEQVEEQPAIAEPTPPVTGWEAPPAFAMAPAAAASPAPQDTSAENGEGDAASSLSGLFGNRGVRVEDEAAALALSALYTNGDASTSAVIAGKPTRAASDEFSLDHVFADAPRRSAELRRSQSFSFDQFFSDGGATPGAGAPPPSAAEPREADIAQFNSWLEGLKKK